jgi:hypothetical protein
MVGVGVVDPEDLQSKAFGLDLGLQEIARIEGVAPAARGPRRAVWEGKKLHGAPPFAVDVSQD